MRIIFFFFFLLFSSCQETDIPFEIPYSGDKLVLWGKLKAGDPVRIQVTKTFNPVGAIPADVTVSDAHVELILNDQARILLAPSTSEMGIYVSDHIVQSGATYVVKATTPNLPVAESNPVTVPSQLPELKVERIKNVPGEINHQTPQDLVGLYFTKQPPAETTYSLFFQAYYPQDTLVAYAYGAIDNIATKEKDCNTFLREKIRTRYNEILKRYSDRIVSKLLMKSTCLLDVTTPLKFFVESGKGDPNTDPKAALKLTMRVEVVTHEAFDYAKVEYDQPEGIDLLVLPTQKAVTNVKNGYGLIYAAHEKVIEIP